MGGDRVVSMNALPKRFRLWKIEYEIQAQPIAFIT
jgi:hypothetical protein